MVRPSAIGRMTSSTRPSAAARSLNATISRSRSLRGSITRPDQSVLSTRISPPGRTRGTSSFQYVG